MSARVTTTPPETSQWHGPASAAGVFLGLTVTALPWTLGLDGAAVWACVGGPPLLGLLLLPVAGHLRRLGVGLVASALAIPVFLTVFLVGITLLDQSR